MNLMQSLRDMLQQSGEKEFNEILRISTEHRCISFLSNVN